MWMYDLAREQSPSQTQLERICRLSLDSGYNALGVYLEHRFRYPSAPWAAGKDCLERETVSKLRRKFPELQIIPFINLLGHMEGFLYSEGGQKFAEERFRGMQACPSNAEFVAFAKGLVQDVVMAFDSELIHIGGDETNQLGVCPECKAKVQAWDAEGVDGKARLYGEHFGPLAQLVKDLGRRPAVWGDMYLEHPQALDAMPKDTLIFDWQYFGGAKESAQQFKTKGFEFVLCPTLHVYDAAWFHLLQSEQNVRLLIREAENLQAFGVCLTTWESGLFASYDTLFPAIAAVGKLINEPPALPKLPISETKTSITDQPDRLDFEPEDSAFLAAYSSENEHYEVWARLMGIELNKCGSIFEFSGHRSVLKSRLLMTGDPFLLWRHHGEELSGVQGDSALRVLEEALRVAPSEEEKGVTLFVRSAIEFARLAQTAHEHYAKRETERAVATLSLTRQLFEELAKIARRTRERIGGSSADIERCRVAREHVERVIARIRSYGDGSLGYVPSFEHVTHYYFVPHDQAAWWLINRWAWE
jgi:hypothetical protein